MISIELIIKLTITGIMMGIIYALMATGITLIYSIMKIINWGMGEYFMIGSYIHYFVVTYIFGMPWYLAIFIAFIVNFIIGILVERYLLNDMFIKDVGKPFDYASIITIGLMFIFRNLFTVFAGTFIYTPPALISQNITIGNTIINGTKFVAAIITFIIYILFYVFIKKTWIGRALQATAQNRIGVQADGINPFKMDELAFGLGCALTGAVGAIVAPLFMVYPTVGGICTMKGFLIIVIAGAGSIHGVLIGGIILGLSETLGGLFINPSWTSIYGYIFLVLMLFVRPRGLFGEKLRKA